MERPRRDLTTSNELIEFLGDLSAPEEPCRFRGIAVDIYDRGFNRISWPLRLLIRLPKRLSSEIGDFARVWLPDPLGIDLFLRSRPELPAEEDSLEAHFEISATSSRLARRRLEGHLAAALIRLNKDYHVVEMRDDSVDFGPLVRRADDIAADLGILVDAFGALDSNLPDDSLVEPDLGPNESFCFYCGFTIRRGAALCPSCGERLDEDQDEDCA